MYSARKTSLITINRHEKKPTVGAIKHEDLQEKIDQVYCNRTTDLKLEWIESNLYEEQNG